MNIIDIIGCIALLLCCIAFYGIIGIVFPLMLHDQRWYDQNDDPIVIAFWPVLIFVKAMITIFKKLFRKEN